ncbi:hypothetical protein DFQ04_2548 [Algoriphagus boseongensis]|uniref:Uncharacterized protein n=1 Tax=Algoriphagus boseongensis TaxID=1442587 RepID=A0A4R6T6Z8_9BACT|nr:hypothetical protein [Algoriphagus boseongensis]TDQ16430.1 hypothetical protein DFQ04_2548 [Algoriphagus boseongensis]
MSRTSSPASILSGPILISLSFGTLAFWFIGTFFDVYQVAFIGAIYELLWLPFLVMLFGLPILTFFLWKSSKYSTKSLYFYALMISTATLLVFLLVESNK